MLANKTVTTKRFDISCLHSIQYCTVHTFLSFTQLFAYFLTVFTRDQGECKFEVYLNLLF